MKRTSLVERDTKETQIRLEFSVNGGGESSIASPVPFLNHMLEAFARHGFFDLDVRAQGDVEIDAHHTVEDIGLTLGDAVAEALGDCRGITRYGSFTLPMDETLATVAVDFCGRPAFVWRVDGLERRWVGDFDCELAREFFSAFSTRARCNLHVLLHYGGNAHHIIEAIFKAFARAVDAATTLETRLESTVPSTKGSLTA